MEVLYIVPVLDMFKVFRLLVLIVNMLQCIQTIVCALLNPIIDHSNRLIRIIDPICEASPNPYLAANYACFVFCFLDQHFIL
jgi:hypothetical protein